MLRKRKLLGRQIEKSSFSDGVNPSNDELKPPVQTSTKASKPFFRNNEFEESEEENSLNALESAFALRKRRKLGSTISSKDVSSRTKVFKKEQVAEEPAGKQPVKVEESTSQGRFVPAVFTALAPPAKSVPTLVKPSEIQAKREANAKLVDALLSSIPITLPKKPGNSVISKDPTAPNTLDNDTSSSYLPGSHIKLPPGQEGVPVNTKISKVREDPRNNTSSDQTSKQNSRKSNSKPNMNGIRPRGLLSTDEEVKNFAVSGKIVEVDLRKRDPNTTVTTTTVVPNKNPKSHSTYSSSGDSSTSVGPKQRLGTSDVLAQSVDYILRSSEPSFIAPTYTKSQQHDKVARSNTNSSSFAKNSQSDGGSNSRVPGETEEEHQKRLRIEQARKMHENIERAMRQRDQRGNGGNRKGNNNATRKNQNQNNNQQNKRTVASKGSKK